MELELTTRRQVTRAMLARYAKGNRAEKGEVLDQLVGVTGWHRDHARKALRRAAAGPAAPGRPREPVVRYRSEVIDALAFCWAVLDGPTGKRLAPALPALVPALRHHDELAVSDEFAEALLSMSAATIDRRLAGHRQKVQIGKGRAMTRPGSLLKSSLPLKTWAEWTDQEPGFTEIDLVSHDGGDNNGHYCWSLCVTDVATGWTQARTVMGKGERGVAAALGQIQLELPFHLAGIHSDNGRVPQPPPGQVGRRAPDHLHPLPPGEQERQRVRRAEELVGHPASRRLLPLRHHPRTRPAQPALAARVPGEQLLSATAETGQQDPNRCQGREEVRHR